MEDTSFDYEGSENDRTDEDLARNHVHTVPVVVQRAAVLRHRAIFEGWTANVTFDVDPEIVDEYKLRNWLEIAGARIGIGDWRPQKSGSYGRFRLDSLDAQG